MNNYRIEHDSMGEVKVPSDKYWGAQTERSRQNFAIGVDREKMPIELIHAMALIKKACAFANFYVHPDRMPMHKEIAISNACDEVISGKLDDQFPLVVWQTGSGTQTNMNLNEVIANRANEIARERANGSNLYDTKKDCEMFRKVFCHPNDDVNMCQSSNDIFPTAMNVAGVTEIEKNLFPAMDSLIEALEKLEKENTDVIKCGRTHLQDAVPMSFAQEISGWKTSIVKAKANLQDTMSELFELAIGGTAIGTGLNSPKNFGGMVILEIRNTTNVRFTPATNRFSEMSSKRSFVLTHGALKALACDLMKIVNDIRFLASGPRNGIGEIMIPENEPGSSIMPGKVNPTQCEAVMMVAVQVMANDAAISVGASQGNLELNTFMPVIIYNFLQSVRLLADGIRSLTEHCIVGIRANREQMAKNVEQSLMLVTALTPYIGYEKAAKVADKAKNDDISLKEACVALDYMTAERFDEIVRPEAMAYPYGKDEDEEEDE